MSDKLNQTLEDIVKNNRAVKRRTTRTARPVRRHANGTKAAAPAAPVGGVKKHTRPAKPADKVSASIVPASGESKINVSNLPHDVTETQIKDYFSKTVGAVKKVLLTYGPNGQSRGICTVIFSQPDSASKAARDLDGIKVDKKPMKIEVLVSASQVPAPAPPKGLGDRITGQPKAAAKPKPQPKPVTAPKTANAKSGPKGAARGRGRGRNAGRGKPKTAEELDAEMQDYFTSGNAADGDTNMNNGAAAQAATAGGDTGMEDEIM